MKEYLKKYVTKDVLGRTLLMLLAVSFMGVAVKLLNMTEAGPDPYSALNYGMSARLSMSFGNYQLLSNLVLFLLVLFQNPKLFGLGTIGNMVVVGYAADFTGWVLDKSGILPEVLPVGARIAILVFALIVFLIAAGIYMNCGLGTSPYDAFSFLIHEKLEKWTKKKLPFRFVRIGYDAVFTALAFLVGGGAGVVTVAMVLLLGPAVDAVAGVMKKRN
ncbi:MAG: YitT family protein [Lachnospiraceae bacterium]